MLDSKPAENFTNIVHKMNVFTSTMCKDNEGNTKLKGKRW